MIDDYIEKWIFAVEIRYPDEFYMPSVAEAKECFSIASKDKDFLLKKII